MYISDLEKNEMTLCELEVYAGVNAKVNYSFDFFESGLSEKEIIVQALLNGISSLIQQNNLEIKTHKKIRKIEHKFLDIKKKYVFFGPWKENKIIDKMVWDYDYNGNLVEWNWYRKDNLVRKVVISNNSNSRLSEQISYNFKNEIEKRVVYKYSQTGVLLEETYYTGDGSLKGKCVYENINDRIASTVFDDSDKIIAKIEYMLSEDNRILEVKGYNADDCLIIGFDYRYDSNGWKIEERCFLEGNIRSDKIVYKYDKEGRRIEDISYDEKDVIRSIIKYTYDSNDNLIGEVYHSQIKLSPMGIGKGLYGHLEQESKIDIMYKYNTEDNWIKKVYLKFEKNLSSRPVSITYREIKYY